MKHDRYLLTHTKPFMGITNEVIDQRLTWIPTDNNELNKKLEYFKSTLKPGETITLHKVTVAKRFFKLEAK